MSSTLKARARTQFDRRSDLRVLFLFDPDGEHRDEIDAWDDAGIRCIEVADPGFSTVYRLEHEWNEDRILLYVPRARPRGRALGTYPLADLLVANAELHVDRAAELASELGLRRDQAAIVEHYYKGDLQYQNRRDFLGSILTPGRCTEKSLKRGLAAYYLDLFKAAPTSENLLLAGIFVRAQDSDAFASYRKGCEERDLSDVLGHLLARRFALDRLDFTREVVCTAAKKLKYNLLIQPIDTVSSDDPYRSKLRVEDTSLLMHMRTLVREWETHPDLTAPYEEVLEALAPDVNVTTLLNAYGAEATFGYLTPTLRRERIRQAAELLPEQPSKSRDTVRDLRDGSDAGAAVAAETVWHIATFYQILKNHPSLDAGSLDAFVDTYTGDLHRCDAHYRQAIRAFQQVRDQHSRYRDAIEDAYTRLLHDYPGRFVQPLNTAWQRALEKDPTELRALSTKGLHTFYATHIGDDAPKTAVIISDGLRYEGAAELMARLQRDKRKQADLGALLAPIPSITSLGKASLLPHQSLRWEDGVFTADGQRTDGTHNRERVLQAVRDEARAMNFEDIRELHTKDGRELFKQHPLVYIYHDRIDAYGDSRNTETETPEAVERTLDELEGFIQTLNNWNVYRVIVTADHGFLYSQLITEAMQEPFPDVQEFEEEREVIRCNRSIVAPAVEGTEGYRFPVDEVSNVDTDWVAAVPRAANRYRLSGAGKRYAHGGASLQELIVPVLEVMKGRKDKAEKVDVRLVTKRNVITAGVLKVQIAQATSVSKKRRSRTLQVGLYDDQGNLISGETELVFDIASNDPTARTQSLMLELKPEANDLNACRLLAYDSEDVNRLNPVINRRFTIQRLFEQDDF